MIASSMEYVNLLLAIALKHFQQPVDSLSHVLRLRTLIAPRPEDPTVMAREKVD